MSNTLPSADAAAHHFLGDLFDVLTTTATWIGFVVLFLFGAGVIWILSVWVSVIRDKRRHKRKNDVEWDNLHSAWLLDMHTRQESEANTDIFDQTVEQIYAYQKEQNDDGS